MKKFFLVLALLTALPFFAQGFDLAAGFGHTWTGAGNYIAGVDRRAVNVQIVGKFVFESGFGVYSGYTQDAVKILNWADYHRFGTFDTSGLERIKALDVGPVYYLKGEKLSGFISAGASGYDSMGETAAGWYALAGVDLIVWKNLFIEVKAEYRSHVTDFAPMDAAAFETGLLVGWKF